MNFIPKLLGYKDFSIDDNYMGRYQGEEYIYKPGGLWINVDIPHSNGNFHFLSSEYLQEIVSNHRIGSIDSIMGCDQQEQDFKFDWKVGEMVFFEYKLYYIQDMFNGSVTGVNDGYGGSSGWDLQDRCYKPDPNVMRISDNVKFWWNEWADLDLPNEYIINGANLHGVLVDIWKYSIDNGDNHKLTNFVEKFSAAIDSQYFDFKWEGEKLFHKVDRVKLVNKLKTF